MHASAEKLLMQELKNEKSIWRVAEWLLSASLVVKIAEPVAHIYAVIEVLIHATVHGVEILHKKFFCQCFVFLVSSNRLLPWVPLTVYNTYEYFIYKAFDVLESLVIYNTFIWIYTHTYIYVDRSKCGSLKCRRTNSVKLTQPFKFH